jgi:branched-chain amino acid transport system ATP-binding protein
MSDRANGAAAARWTDNPILTVEHLTMRFGGVVAVDDLSFSAGRGDITALIGPNGAGKTTVFNCITGFYKPTEGRIALSLGDGLGREAIASLTRSDKQYLRMGDGAVYLLERMPDFRIAQHAKVARTFQNIRLFGGMTVLENLLIAQHHRLMLASGYSIAGLFNLPVYRRGHARAMEQAVYWLERINLVERADDPASGLPYGDQRRLEIARSMCTEPALLCLDEPAAGLNPRETAELNQFLDYVRSTHGTSILLIEHDMGVVMEISDHIVVLDYGEKISDGTADHVRNDPRVIAAYLGVEDEEAEAIDKALQEGQTG